MDRVVLNHILQGKQMSSAFQLLMLILSSVIAGCVFGVAPSLLYKEFGANYWVDLLISVYFILIAGASIYWGQAWTKRSALTRVVLSALFASSAVVSLYLTGVRS
jgi:hypothetical protein